MRVIEQGLLTESDLPGPSWLRMAVAGLSQTLTPGADPTLGPERLGPERLGPERREITLTVSRTLRRQPWFHPTLDQLKSPADRKSPPDHESPADRNAAEALSTFYG